MANTFISIQEIARQALPRLIENLVFPNLVHKDFSSDFVLGKGATVQVRKPVVLVANDFDASTGTTAQGITEQSETVTLDKLATVDAEWGAVEGATSVDDINRLFIEPAAYAIAEKINADGLALAKSAGNSLTIGSAAGNVSGLDVFAAAGAALNKEKAPLTERYGIWSPKDTAAFQTIPALVNAEKSGTTEALRNGSIGKVFGIENYMAQGVATDSTNSVNVVFNKNAFAFVTRPLAAPSGVESYTTSYNGISLRVTRGYDMKYKKEMISMDVLYGYKVMYPKLAVKVLSAK